jgi:hypothetical protein
MSTLFVTSGCNNKSTHDCNSPDDEYKELICDQLLEKLGGEYVEETFGTFKRRDGHAIPKDYVITLMQKLSIEQAECMLYSFDNEQQQVEICECERRSQQCGNYQRDSLIAYNLMKSLAKSFDNGLCYFKLDVQEETGYSKEVIDRVFNFDYMIDCITHCEPIKKKCKYIL